MLCECVASTHLLATHAPHLSVGSTCVYREDPDTKTTIAIAMATAGMAKPIAHEICSQQPAGFRSCCKAENYGECD